VVVVIVIIIVEARAPRAAPEAAARLSREASFDIRFVPAPKRQAEILSVNRVNFALQHNP
jgi:hypothetical protein